MEGWFHDEGEGGWFYDGGGWFHDVAERGLVQQWGGLVPRGMGKAGSTMGLLIIAPLPVQYHCKDVSRDGIHPQLTLPNIT